MTRLQLIVEGDDDKHVVGHLLRRRGIEVLEPKTAGGVQQLLEISKIYLKASYDAVAVVLDADLDVTARWQSMRDRLIESGYHDIPAALPAAGLIVTAEGKAPAGVWIMPDNTVPGSLEHFVEQLIPEGDELWPVAQRVVADLPQTRFSSTAKAEIHTWLAWQEEPGTPMGSAINQKYLGVDSPIADRFVAWIERLLTIGS